jgi:hypothetical protein
VRIILLVSRRIVCPVLTSGIDPRQESKVAKSHSQWPLRVRLAVPGVSPMALLVFT